MMSHDEDFDFTDDDENLDDTYLAFCVGQEEYAVPVASVTEIVRLQQIFEVPDVPEFIKGVINLRGKVIPLLDVRSRFDMEEVEYSDRTVIIVLEIGSSRTGLVVDGVTEVVEIPPDAIESRPSWREEKQGDNHGMVRGMGRRGDRVSFILDVDRLVDINVESISEPNLQAAA